LRLTEPRAPDRTQKVIYTIWNLWQDRCRRVFDNKGLRDMELRGIAMHDIALWQTAWRGNDRVLSNPG
jgi:hypothetical protein